MCGSRTSCTPPQTTSPGSQRPEGVAHCPTSNGRLGSGIAPIADMLAAGVPVGLGVDGSASDESGRMDEELHQALLVARLRGGSTAMSAREVLKLATTGGARVLGRDGDLGSLEVGKLADVALWRVDGLPGADINDPVCTLVFGSRSQLELLLVGGRPIVEFDHLLTADTRPGTPIRRRVGRTARTRAVGHAPCRSRRDRSRFGQLLFLMTSTR